MGIDEISKEEREEILRIARKHGVGRISIFGSFARGEAGKDSDIDFIDRCGRAHPPWFPGGLVADLEELLGRHIDVVEADAIRDGMRARILKEAVPL